MVRRHCRRAFPFLALLLVWSPTLQAQKAPQAEDNSATKGRSGQMVSIRGRIDSNLKDRIVEICNQAVEKGVEIIVLDIQAGPSDFGPCLDLASAVADLRVRRTVAFVSGPVTGHSTLVALACDEIVMHPEAILGDIYRDAPPRRADLELAAYERITKDKGHDPAIAKAMTDASLVLNEVRTPMGKRLVTSDQMEAFRRENRVLESQVVKEASTELILDAALAERIGLVRRTASTRREVAVMYEMPEQTAAQDPLFGADYHPIVLKLEGTIDNRLYEYVRRRLKQAQDGGYNLLFVQIDSSHGDETAASNIANVLTGFGANAKVVAYVPRQATGTAVLPIFACDELVVARDAVVGDFRMPNPEQGKVLAESAVNWASGSRFPLALVRGFVDPTIAIYQVQSKTNPSSKIYVTKDELETAEIQEKWHQARPVKEKDVVLQMDGIKARTLDMATAVASNTDELQSLYGIEARIPILQPGWVDAVVQALTSTGGTFFLLFLGMICLYMEFQIPGFGVAGLMSAACFTLFFWSRFLVDQAHSLEIVMFLLGVAFIAVEMFVLPGFGFAGISGLILVVCSLILASQSFTVPTNAEETRELTINVVTLASVLIVSMVSILGLSRYFPRMPLLNKLILAPEEEDAEQAWEEGDDRHPYDELLGQQGVAASPLRPAGRMQFAGQFYDVVAKGEFIEAGQPIEVVEVFQNRIVVRHAEQT